MNNKAVILGCNYYIGLSVIRCLGKQGIHTVAVDYSPEGAYGALSKYTSERLIAPHYRDEKSAFIAFLKDYAQKQSAPPVLFPCHDSYVEVIDEYLDELRQYYLIPQTEQGLYTKMMNKEVLHRLAEENGVNVPETVRVHEENFLDRIDEVIKYPCVVKPTDSPSFVAKFRRKLFKVNNRKELLEALEKAEQAGLEVIVQRIIPGFDDHMHTFDAYLNQDAKVTHWTTCQKFRQYPINFGASVFTAQKHVPELYDIGGTFLEKMGWKGFAEIEFKKDADTGQFYLIEVNVRMTNFNYMLYEVGLNMPHITYRELTGSPLKPMSVTHTTGRAFWYFYEDMLAVRDYIKTKQLTAGQVFRSLFRPKTAAIWEWSDPKPGMAYVSMIGGKLVRKLLRK
ncbi:carboxylate--amine ligase [Paenibacillus sp. J5C_2022]|uniref:carboxylate--amine ligase n=1 Tax=Paenibacillus sp. J5C2022 TaxID=2977129 RepID=UPI0021D0C0B5|nr:carboxylate--amine ligase [Paenibacillus sp. J5C2022]MCU6708561.1 carboxylate--amine ligase [Paenibacillus sp. J5C2022]